MQGVVAGSRPGRGSQPASASVGVESRRHLQFRSRYRTDEGQTGSFLDANLNASPKLRTRVALRPRSPSLMQTSTFLHLSLILPSLSFFCLLFTCVSLPPILYLLHLFSLSNILFLPLSPPLSHHLILYSICLSFRFLINSSVRYEFPSSLSLFILFSVFALYKYIIFPHFLFFLSTFNCFSLSSSVSFTGLTFSSLQFLSFYLLTFRRLIFPPPSPHLSLFFALPCILFLPSFPISVFFFCLSFAVSFFSPSLSSLLFFCVPTFSLLCYMFVFLSL